MTDEQNTQQDKMHRYDWVRFLSRGAGHTRAACGKGDGEHIVVVATARFGEHVRREYGNRTVVVDFADRSLQGSTKPVVFDHDAVAVMVGNLVRWHEERLKEETLATAEAREDYETETDLRLSCQEDMEREKEKNLDLTKEVERLERELQQLREATRQRDEEEPEA